MQTTTAIRSLRASNKCSSPSLVLSTSSSLRHCPLSLSSRQHQHHQQNRHYHHRRHYKNCQQLLLIRSNCFRDRNLTLRFIGNNCCARNGFYSSSSSKRRSIFTISTSSKTQETNIYQGKFKQQPHLSLSVQYQQKRYVASSRRTTKRLRVQPAPSLVPGGLNGAPAAITGVQYSDHIVFNPPSSMPSVYHTPMKFLPKNDPRRKLYESHLQALTGSSSLSTSSSSLSPSSPSSSPSGATSATSLPPSSSSDSSSSPPSWIPSQYIAKAGIPAAGWTRYTTRTASSSSTPHPSGVDSSSSSSSDSSNGITSDASLTAATTAPTPSLPPMIRPIKPKKYHLTPADMDEMRRLRAEDPRTWTRSKLAEKFQCSNLFVGFVCRSPEMKRENEAKMATNRARWGRRKTEAKEDQRKRREMWGRDV